MSGEQLPFPWEIRYSSSKGANYFYNPSNGVSTWNHPSLEADHPNQSPYPSHIHAGQPTHNRARDDRYAQSQQINRPSTRAPLSTQPQSTAARSALQPHQSADRGRVEAWTSSGNSVGGSPPRNYDGARSHRDSTARDDYGRHRDGPQERSTAADSRGASGFGRISAGAAPTGSAVTGRMNPEILRLQASPPLPPKPPPPLPSPPSQTTLPAWQALPASAAANSAPHTAI